MDDDYLRRPHRWDLAFIRTFMIAVGPVSSLFDFAAFFVLLHVLDASAPLFHTGWFVESLATQVLVIFVVRTRASPLRSRPHPGLVATSLGVVAVTVVVPLSPLGPPLGFVPLPPLFYAILTAMVVLYLLAVETVKRWFFRRRAAECWPPATTRPSPASRAPSVRE